MTLPEQYSHQHAGQLVIRCPKCYVRHSIDKKKFPPPAEPRFECACGTKFDARIVLDVRYYTQVVREQG